MQGKILLPVILFLALLIRIPYFDYPLSDIFWWGDGTRDYLVANHILKYGEFPVSGPFNLLFDTGIKNSPLYFYILAFFLLIYNHPLTLSFFNILLQILNLVLIYFIAKKMFGSTTALWVTAIYSFNPAVLEQSDYIWQPNLMQPFALLSVLLLIHQKFWASVTSFFLAFAIHSSAFPVLPVILLKLRKAFSIPLILFLVVFLFLLLDRLPGELAVKNIGEYATSLQFNLNQIHEIFNINILLLTFVSFLYFYEKLPLLPFLLFLSPVLLASLFNKIRPHYLTVSYPFLSLWIVALINSVFHKKSALVLFIIFLIFTNGLSFLKPDKKPLENFYYMENISNKIVLDLQGIDSFRIQTLGLKDKVYDYPILDTILLVPLEEKLNKKLAKVSDESAYNHVQTGSSENILFSCIKFKMKKEDLICMEELKKKFNRYQLVKKVYLDNNLEIYLLTSIKVL